MHIIDILKEYKKEFLNIGVNENQRRFLYENFAKFFMNSDKIGIEDLFPSCDILSYANSDITYANAYKNTNFDIGYVIQRTQSLYEKYYDLVVDILYDTRRTSNSEDFWMPVKPLLNKKQISRLKYLYSLNVSKNSNFDKDYKYLINLYQLIDIGSTVHLSIPPIFSGVELFGTLVNTHNREFCSLFHLERKFGSLGSFWEYKFHRDGIYIANPPFDEKIISKMSEKLITDLANTMFDIIVIITIPVWDHLSQQKAGMRDYQMNFEGYNNLINSSFLCEKLILDKFEFKYYDYCTKKKVPSSHTHLILLSNMSDVEYKKKININDFTNAWRLWSLG